MGNQERPATVVQEPAREEATEETKPRMDRDGTPGAGLTLDSSPVRRELRRALSSRRALREAILLHEILGPPKGMERSET